MADLSRVSISKLVRGVSAAIAGWNGEALEYADVRDGALVIRAAGANTHIASETAVWGDSAPANTAVNVDIDVPAMLSSNTYILFMKNPSAVTDITVVVQTRIGEDYYEVTRVVVPKQIKRTLNVFGWLLADGGRLSVTNNTALGAGQGFAAGIHVYQS